MGGATLAFVGVVVLPALIAEVERERRDKKRFKSTPLQIVTTCIYAVFCLGSGVAIAHIFKPCTIGDALLAGLGAVGAISAVSNAGTLVFHE